MNEEEIAAPNTRHISMLWVILPAMVVVICGVGVYLSWQHWQARIRTESENQRIVLQRLDEFQHVIDQFRSTQHATQQTLQDIGSADRVLRDELLGLEQRHALLEQHVDDLSKREDNNLDVLRQSEVEALLRIGLQRLTVVGDLDGARQAYALAAQALEEIDTPGILTIRQLLNQERHALDQLHILPVQAAKIASDALINTIDHLPEHDLAKTQSPLRPDPWWKRILAPLVRIEPSDGAVSLLAADRLRLKDAMAIEWAIVRAALERHDINDYQRALQRIGEYVKRIWPPSAARTAALAKLHELQHISLDLHLPELGTTLAQLHSHRLGREIQ